MNIKDIQQALTMQGFDTKGIDGIAGVNTYAAIAAFQNAHGFKANGVLNWATLQAILPDFVWSDKLNERALQIASLLVGVREEKGPNDGVMVAAFQKDTGNHVGDSWCMSFAYWCYDEAAHSLGVKNPLIPTGGSLDQLNRSKCRVIPAAEYTDPQPGDIGILDHGGGKGHAYLVKGPGGAGVVDTIEGNSNTDGSSNGNGAYARQRITNKAKAYIRP
jgi:peptidoglycan hydrolase-like protein with peptidoglycan-binding domain